MGPGLARLVGRGTAVARSGLRAHPPPEGAADHAGGTTFNFVTDGIESALTQARAAANGRTVLVAGGASTVNQYLAAGLVDDLWLHIAPMTLGSGERLFDGADVQLEPVDARNTDLATHVRYRVLRQ